MKKEVEAVAEEEEKTEETAPEVQAKEEETAAEAEALPEGIPDVDTADFGNTQVPFFHILFLFSSSFDFMQEFTTSFISKFNFNLDVTLL